MKEKVVKGHRACFACSINCTKYSVVPSGRYKSIINGPDYETVYGFGSICEVDDIKALCKADEVCDEYGIDLIQASMSVAWAMECYEKGIFTKEDTGGLDLSWGNADAMIELTEMIGKREGPRRAAGQGDPGSRQDRRQGLRALRHLQQGRGLAGSHLPAVPRRGRRLCHGAARWEPPRHPAHPGEERGGGS